MAIKLTDSIRVGQQKPVDDKYFNGLVPYISTDEVNSLISINVRHRGLTVNINGEEYWYKDGIGNDNLVLKIINSDALDGKQDKLSSYDESILIENDGNIESNISLFEEYFEQQECELNFEPIQIVAVYQDGIKLLNSEYEIILPKKIKIKEYVDENIQIEYTHLKS